MSGRGMGRATNSHPFRKAAHSASAPLLGMSCVEKKVLRSVNSVRESPISWTRSLQPKKDLWLVRRRPIRFLLLLLLLLEPPPRGISKTVERLWETEMVVALGLLKLLSEFDNVAVVVVLNERIRMLSKQSSEDVVLVMLKTDYCNERNLYSTYRRGLNDNSRYEYCQ